MPNSPSLLHLFCSWIDKLARDSITPSACLSVFEFFSKRNAQTARLIIWPFHLRLYLQELYAIHSSSRYSAIYLMKVSFVEVLTLTKCLNRFLLLYDVKVFRTGRAWFWSGCDLFCSDNERGNFQINIFSNVNWPTTPY